MRRDIISPIWLGFLGGVTLLQAPWFARVHQWTPNIGSPPWIRWASSDAHGSWSPSCLANSRAVCILYVFFALAQDTCVGRLCPMTLKKIPTESHILAFERVYERWWVWHRAWSRSGVAVTVSSTRRDRGAVGRRLNKVFTGKFVRRGKGYCTSRWSDAPGLMGCYRHTPKE